MDIQEELRKIVAAFNSKSVEYALCSGMAVAFHGYSRFTKDIDILIDRSSLELALKTAEEVGFLDSPGKINFPDIELHRILKVEGAEYLVLDLMVYCNNDDVGPLSKTWFEWEGLPICVVSAEGLVLMKRKAGRAQDLLDIKMLGFET